MGKIRTRTIGLEEVEKKQKSKQKEKSEEKKRLKKESKKEKNKEEKKTVVSSPVKKEKIQNKKETSEKSDKRKKEIRAKIRGKKYTTSKQKIDKNKQYSIRESIQMLKKIRYANFDESVELHINVDKTGLKGEIELPHPTGKTTRVKIVDDAVVANLEKGIIDFDVLITHPSYMAKLAKFARTLGPKGLMPNPKAGTISLHPEEVAKKFSKGTLRWKTESKFPLIHQMIGKISFDEKTLIENITAFLTSVKKQHIKKTFIKTTMSPAIILNLETI